MRILFLAPQPFYQERGTPIAVRLALEALSEKLADGKHSIDLLTYSEGEKIEIVGVRTLRAPTPKFLHGVRPGISVKKLLCDLCFALSFFLLLWRSRKDRYTLIHAVEESVFMAAIAKVVCGIPYIYDMDSSLSLQLTEQWRYIKPLTPLFEWLERAVIRGSLAVAPVCDTLLEVAQRQGAHQTVLLRDVSLLADESVDEPLRKEIGVGDRAIIMLYVGNLEKYQGIDLLVESFKQLAATVEDLHLVVIGGQADHVTAYRVRVSELSLRRRVHFLGARPVSRLGGYLRAADILVSPRTKGNNTPMKIYSYLHAGRAIVATNLATHTQVLDSRVAVLSDPNAQAFAEGLRQVAVSAELRATLGARAFERAQQLYTRPAFKLQLNQLYDGIYARIC